MPWAEFHLGICVLRCPMFTSCCQGKNLKHKSICIKGEEAFRLTLFAVNSYDLLSGVPESVVVNLFCECFHTVVNSLFKMSEN